MVDSDHQSEAPQLPPWPVNEDQISMPPICHIEEKLMYLLATLRHVDEAIRHSRRADWHHEACRRIYDMEKLTYDALGDTAFIPRRKWIPPSPLPDLQTQLHTAASSGTQGGAPSTRRHP